MSTYLPSSWLCCQIGAREHYSIPRALHTAGFLHTLLTDLWLPPEHPLLYVLGKRGAGRFHSGLDGARVLAWNGKELAAGLKNKLKNASGWPAVIDRNKAFQRAAVRQLAEIHKQDPAKPFVLFSYSYAAKSLFQFGKSVGWTTVLGQIDPGPMEERIVAGLHHEVGKGTDIVRPAPLSYWDEWRAECGLADFILVNSEWSRQALKESGIADEKLSIVPLVFQPEPEAAVFERAYPTVFTSERPLRLLFLGQAGLRKGIHLITKAAEELTEEPVEIRIVGPLQITIPSQLANHPILRWCGPIPRSATAMEYRQADCFLFPTFSDGFGLTQLEAQAWKLPLLVSRFCGQVVEHDVNGLILDPLNTDTLVAAIRALLRNPSRLVAMSRLSSQKSEHRIDGLVERLQTAIGLEPFSH